MSTPPAALVRLDSGLRVAVQPLPDAAVSSAHLWFDAGAADERSAQAGAAHFVEHLLFKGTPSRGIGMAAAEVEGLGGDLNAWTSWDETVIHATCAGDAVAGALDVIIDMARASLFDADELERERQVVLEEMRGYDADPDTLVVNQVQARIFGDHPYGRPVIGHMKTVREVSREALRDFWRSHYHPGRAVLAVAGPVELREVAQLAERLTDGWPVARTRSSLRSPRGLPPGEVLLREDFGSILVQLAWPGLPVGHPDEAAVDVLAFAMGEGVSARLPVLLDLEHGVASHVWADHQPLLGGGLLGLGFMCGDTAEAIRLTLREVSRVARYGLLPLEVARAREGIEADLWFGAETAHGVASELAWSVARTGRLDAQQRYLDAIRQVTAQDVHRVAARWMSPDQAHVVVLDRSWRDAGRLGQVRKASEAPDRARPLRAASAGSTPTWQVGPLRIAVHARPSPVAAVRILARGGQLRETGRTAGLAEAWARTVTRAAGPYDPRALAALADQLSLRIDAEAGRATQGLGATFPAEHLDQVLDLLGHVLADPHFAEDDWNQIHQTMVEDLGAVDDDADTVAVEALWRGLWPSHPFRLPALGTQASLGNLTAHRLRSFHRAAMAASGLVVGVAGGVDADAVLRGVERWAEDLPADAAALPPTPPGEPQTSARVRRAGAAQATVLLGTRGVAANDPDRLALAVAASLLDSQAGRLFLALRERAGLAYSVWATSEVNAVGGVFSVGLATDPAQVGTAARGLRREVLRLAEQSPSHEELARTRRMLLGQAAARAQRVASQAFVLAQGLLDGRDYGLDQLEASLGRLEPADVREALARRDVEHLLRVTVVPR